MHKLGFPANLDQSGCGKLLKVVRQGRSRDWKVTTEVSAGRFCATCDSPENIVPSRVCQGLTNSMKLVGVHGCAEHSTDYTIEPKGVRSDEPAGRMRMGADLAKPVPPFKGWTSRRSSRSTLHQENLYSPILRYSEIFSTTFPKCLASARSRRAETTSVHANSPSITGRTLVARRARFIASKDSRDPTGIPRTVKRRSKNRTGFTSPLFPPKYPITWIWPPIRTASKDFEKVPGPPTSRTWSTPRPFVSSRTRLCHSGTSL